MTIIFSSIFARALGITLLLSLLLGSGNAIGLPLVRSGDALTLNGTSGTVTITRDDAGVPHIRTASEVDAQFGLGYVHAQDRLWQMEWQRRLASGRTAEFLGDKGLQFDMLFRTVGIRRAAEATWARLTPADRQPIESYVAGINTFLTSHAGKSLPPEYGILGITAEPWSPVDVLAFGKLFVWGNGSNWDKELLRGQLAAMLGPERAAQLTPAYTADGPTIVPSGDGRRTTNVCSHRPSSIVHRPYIPNCWNCTRQLPRRLVLARMGAAATPG